MGLNYYLKQFNNSDNLSPLYANTSALYNKIRSSRSSPPETFISIEKYNRITYHLERNIYANISKLPTDMSNDGAYTALMNTEIGINSQTLEENNTSRIYENVQVRSTSASHQKTSPKNLSPSSHIYFNLNQTEDKPSKTDQDEEEEEEEEVQLSSISSIEIKQVDIETKDLKKRSNTKTKSTVKQLEVNMVPSCRDKSDLYRTKLRQRRTLHRARRYRRRSSTPFRAIRRQQHHSNSNTSIHQPMFANKRLLQKSVSNQLYNVIQQPIVSAEYPILPHHILAWRPTVSYHEEEEEEEEEEEVPHVFSTSENGESIQQEEEFRPHDIFEDFLLRRPKSSCSTLGSVTNTIISSETISEDTLVRPPPLNPRSPGAIALGLDKKDKDFIHDIIQRTQGDHRVSNRIAALKEAYIRAENKRTDLLKIKKMREMNENKNKKKIARKPSFISSKIRDELEKYDELPAHRKKFFDDDDEETYSANDGYRYRHRRLPPVPSTTHRIINFVTTLKNQLQKNFQEIRSRILIELMSNPRHRSTFHNYSGPSHRPRSAHHVFHRTNSHHSIEHSYPFHRQQFSRTHSSTSQIHSYHPSSSFDKHLSNRPRTFRVTPHLQQRRQQQRMN